jgi:hypothetical protein
MKKHLTLSQRIHNAEGAQAVEYLHATHAYLHGMTHGKEEWGEIWSRRDDVSWAHGFGRWRGFQAVWWGNVASYNWRGISPYKDMFDLVPEITWLTDFRSLSEVAMHTLGTDIIEVADDGQTARGFFVTPGVLYSALQPNMKYKGQALWERYGSDFVFEDGEWKYLHEQVCPDAGGPFDVGNVGVDTYKNLVNPPPPGVGGPPGMDSSGLRLTDPGPLHHTYTPVQVVQNTVPWPEPYVTMDNNNTYTKTV